MNAFSLFFSFRFVLVLFEYYMFVAASYSLLTSVIFAHDFVIISVPKINTMELHRANIKCKEMKRRNRHTTENQKTHRVGRICVEKCRLGVFFRLKYIYATTVQQEHNFAKFMHSHRKRLFSSTVLLLISIPNYYHAVIWPILCSLCSLLFFFFF